MVPSHIQVKEMAKILIAKGGATLHSKFFESLDENQTIEDLFQTINAKPETSQQSNGIIDLYFDINKVFY